jgi:translation initiation factor eIF-2B subunit delta
VLAVLEAIHRAGPVQVWCSESRPANEGRALAARLAAGGIPVTCVLDAAIGQSLAAADAALVGADAIAAGWFVNKAGTRMLAAAASAQGVPVYVVASRDKFACANVAARLTLREGPPAEVWRDPPPGVGVRNVYFETIPNDLVARFITDEGVLDAGMARQVCEALDRERTADLVSLVGGPR